jgi:predicted ArsR family transcriptional regulator
MAIFQKLTGGPMAVHELAGMLPVSRPAVSQHLRVMKEAGLVSDSRAGTRRVYQLNPEGIARLRAHFDQVWEQALSAFQKAAESPQSSPGQSPETGEKHEQDGGSGGSSQERARSGSD